jgi:hypothetical protein
LRLRADFVHTTIDRPISSITASPALEAAFPKRFERDEFGELTRVDLRPVNFDRARRDTLRVGLSFSKPLASRRPSQAFMDQMRAQRGAPPPTGSGDTRPPREGGGERTGGFGGRGGGGGFGGRNRGRLQFSLTDTINLVDRVTIRDGLALDYLRGEAIGQTGGRPRHEVEAQAGWSNNGLGARLSGNWRSGTQVETLAGDDLRFSSYGTLDLRLFANLGEQFELVAKQPWLRGSSVRLEVNNLLDSRPRVRDAAGVTPLNYQGGLLEPLGRTVSVSFRKLFLPPRSFFQRQREQRDRQEGSAPR